MTHGTRSTGLVLGGLVLLGISYLAWQGLGSDPLDTDGIGSGDAIDPYDASTPYDFESDAARQDAVTRARLAGSAPEAADRSPGFVRALAGFTGRLLRGTGDPAADTEVTILRVDNEALLQGNVDLLGLGASAPAPDLVAGTARSDAEGRFRVTGVWPSSFYVLHAGRGTESSTSRILNRTPGPGEVVDLGDIYLVASAVVVGRVLDDGDKPIAGAVIRAAAIPDALLDRWPVERFDAAVPVLYVGGDEAQVLQIPEWVRDRLQDLGIASTRTGADGRFRLTGVQPDRVAVFVTDAGRLPAVHRSTKVVAAQETDLGDITLARGASVRGRVLDDRGRPLAGAEVLVGQGIAVAPLMFPTPAGFTDAKGRFAASGFRPGRVVVAGRRTPATPWVVSESQPIQEEVILRIPSSGDLTVQVRSRTGAALTDVRFKLLQASPDGSDVDLGRFGFRRPIAIQARLSRVRDGEYRLPGLQFGRYVLLVGAAGHRVERVEFRLERDTELAVELTKQDPFEVLVTDSDGEPVADAQVSVSVSADRGAAARGLPLPCGRTDEDGRLQVTQAPADKIIVRVAHPAHGTARRLVELPVRHVHVVLEAPGAIEGTLTDAGKPPEPGKWNLAVRPKRKKQVRGSGDPLALPKLAVPGTDGVFRFPGLPPGEYQVSVIAAAAAASPLELAIHPGRVAKQLRSPDRSKVVPVHAGRTTHVQIDTLPDADYSGPTGPVTGTVTINGRPAVGFEVRGWHQRWLLGPVGPDGRFDLGPVPVGYVGLYLADPKSEGRGRNAMPWWEQIHVQSEQAIDLRIDLRLGTIAGTVVHADGHRVAGCRVRLRGASKGPNGELKISQYSAITDRQGGFSVKDLPEGTYDAIVWDSSLGRGIVDDTVVKAGTQTQLRMELTRIVAVTGRVDLRLLGTEKPRAAWLQLYGRDEQGGYLSKEWGAHVGSDGSFRIRGIRRGRYEIFLGAEFRGVGKKSTVRMFVHDTLVDVGGDGLRDLTLRPQPVPETKRKTPTTKEPAKAPAETGKPKETKRNPPGK